MRAIKSLRLEAWSASCASRSRWAAKACSAADRDCWRASMSAVRRVLSSARSDERRARSSRSLAIEARRAASWSRSLSQRFGLALEFADRRAEHHRGADRLGHVLRPNQDRRRRVAPHALQHGQNVGDDAAPILERAAQGVGAGVEGREAFVGRDDLPFRLLHLCGRVDQGGVEPRPVGAIRLDVGFDAPALLVGGAHRVFDAAQPGFLSGLVVALRADAVGVGTSGSGGGAEDRDRRPSANAPSAPPSKCDSARHVRHYSRSRGVRVRQNRPNLAKRPRGPAGFTPRYGPG